MRTDSVSFYSSCFLFCLTMPQSLLCAVCVYLLRLYVHMFSNCSITWHTVLWHILPHQWSVTYLNSSVVLAFGPDLFVVLTCSVLHSRWLTPALWQFDTSGRWEERRKGSRNILSFTLCLGQHCWQWPHPLGGSPTHKAGSIFCWVTPTTPPPPCVPSAHKWERLPAATNLPCPRGKASDSNTKTRPKKKERERLVARVQPCMRDTERGVERALTLTATCAECVTLDPACAG